MDVSRGASVHDRLSALRQQTPVSSRSSGFPRNVFIIGAVVVVMFLAVVGVLVTRSAPTVITADTLVVPPQIVAPPDLLLDGEAYIAIAAEMGSFPPQLGVGDTVRVVVAPNFASESLTQSLPDVAVVADVVTPSEFSATYVITIRAPESVATAIADAEKVHLAILKRATS